MIVSKRFSWFRQEDAFPFCVAIFVVILVLTMPSVRAHQPNVATASFVVLSGTNPYQRDEKTIQGCFVFVPPSDSPKFNKYPEMRRWLDAHRGRQTAKQHSFKLEGGAILPAAAIFRVGDSIDRYLDPYTPLSLTMFSNEPMSLGPSIIRNYTFEKTELGPIRISAVAQAATTSHALILDHEFGAASDENGSIVMPGLPVGIDIPMRVSIPAAKQNIHFRSDTLDVKNNGWFVVRLEDDSESFQIVATATLQDQESSEQAQPPADSLPPCVRVSGAAQDSSRLLLSATKMTLGCGPCSETCEITADQILELLRKHPTVQELQLWGWPVSTAECQDLLRGIATIPHVHRVSLMGLQVDKPLLSIIAGNPHVRELALGGRCRFSERNEDSFAWVFDAIAESDHLETLDISRHTEVPCSELSRLDAMPRLKHLIFDGLIDKPCLEGIARLRHLVSLELPKFDPAEHGVDYLSELKHLQHLTCTWSDRHQPTSLRKFSALQSLTLLADPRFVDWEAIKSLPQLRTLSVQIP